MEVYSQEQLNYKTGGPLDVKLLYSIDELKKDFYNFPSIQIKQVERVINEGKFHQVKKMFYAIKHPVCKGGLHRLRLGALTLAASEDIDSKEMNVGEIRPLFESEKKKLVSLYNGWLISEKTRFQL